MDVGAKICLICGINANKIAKHDRYNVVSRNKKVEKGRKDLDESDSDDSSSNSRSKKKAPPARNARAPAAVGGSTRQTRNQNPKSFAASLCKAMELPPTQDHPFLQIFSRADYCADCMGRVKEVHSSLMELEKVQKRISEFRVDIELDMSKHLQKIPFCKNVLRTDDFSRYKEDLDLILDFHGTDKSNDKSKNASGDEKEVLPKKQRRQAAINSSIKLKRKLEEDEEDSEEAIVVKVSKQERDSEFTLEESNSGESSQEPEPNGTSGDAVKDGTPEDVVGKDDAPEDGDVKHEAIDAAEPAIKEEAKPVPVVRERVKKDPNLKCPHCPIPRYFNILESLEEHVVRAHTDKKKQVCDICEKRFHSVTEVRLHKLRVHDIVDASNPGWSCGFCDQDFSQKRYLEDHLDQHQESKPLNCQHCGKSFKRKESLKRAFQIYKGETVDACFNCNRNLNLKDYLEHNRRLRDSK